jgi:hypothetical protein
MIHESMSGQALVKKDDHEIVRFVGKGGQAVRRSFSHGRGR